MLPIRDAMSGAFDQGQGEIGHGGQGNDMHFPRLRGAQRLHHEVHSMLLLRPGRGRGQLVPIETRRPVNVLGSHQLSQNRARTSGKHRDIGAPGKLQDLERVDDGMIEFHIACGGYQAEDLKRLRRGQHHHDGRCFILPGVGGDNHFHWLQRTFSVTSEEANPL